MIFDFFHYLFLAHFCCFFFFFIIFCCLWVAACGNVKLLLPRKCWHFQFECKSHGLKSSNIELSVESITRQSARLPQCIHTRMASVSICARMYVCVDFVIVVCKSCLTTRYEFVEYEAQNMVADTVVFIVPLIEYANAFSHVRPVSRQRQTATATKSWKQARWRRRTTQKSFYLGGLVDMWTDIRRDERCSSSALYKQCDGDKLHSHVGVSIPDLQQTRSCRW